MASTAAYEALRGRFAKKARVDWAMGDAPYRRRHENLAGVDVLPNNPPWQFFTKLFVILGTASQ
jgi:hypothetical protein